LETKIGIPHKAGCFLILCPSFHEYACQVEIADLQSNQDRGHPSTPALADTHPDVLGLQSGRVGPTTAAN